jgi:hypothetical protein
MAQFFTELPTQLQEFIRQQKMFFVATAAPDGRINLSPKGRDSLRVLGANRVAWLNLTGSGNETAAHLLEKNRMTLMFCAFEGPELILRLYGSAKIVHPRDAAWAELFPLFPPIPGARQIFDMNVDSAQTSCGLAVPLFEFKAQRDGLEKWATKQGDAGLQDYWERKNQASIDGKPTEIIVKELATT